METELDRLLPLNERPSTAELARKVIDKIRSARGHIDDRDRRNLEKTDSDWAEEYQQRAEQLRSVYARYTKTVSDQLYTSKFRFLYEVLQNADDAEYGASKPTIAIRVRPTELVVETNEVGFTRANVEAICATGESSKARNIDTTGEKGLGFKSVFAIAKTVHVQSGCWTFCFNYQREENNREDGLGMVIPIWVTPSAELPAGIGTRFTLQYASSDDEFLTRLLLEVDKIHETVVFGLRRLKTVEIAFENVLGRDWTRKIEKAYNHSSSDLCIVQTKQGCEVHETSRMDFKVFSMTAENLPMEGMRRSSESRVTIAFQHDPLTRKPIIPERGQHVFAFLPIQRIPQLQFLIQADFILAANGEAIPEGAWNIALRGSVAEAFRIAVLTMCGNLQHPLRYEWPHYLPVAHIEGFWEPLYESIKVRLKKSSILESRKDGVMKRPGQLRELPSMFLHAGKPLLRDLPAQDTYLSAQYDRAQLSKLRDLGLKPLDSSEIVDRIVTDLRAPDSSLYTTPLDHSWHKDFRSLIGHVEGDPMQRSRIRQLHIIPLNPGTWASLVSLSGDPVYLPILIQESAVSIEIPNNLGLRKLHPSACKDMTSEAFYTTRGVISLERARVIQQILATQKKSCKGAFKDVRDAVRHLEVLFWYGEKPTDELWATSQKRWHRTSQLYFPSSDPFDAQKLVGSASWDGTGSGILESRYLNSQVRFKVINDYTWTEWLQKVAKVRYHPRMAHYVSKSSAWILDPLLGIVAGNDSVMFLAALKAHWTEYQFDCFPSVVTEVQELCVLCRNGSTVKLPTTMLPKANILAEARRLGVDNALSFVKLTTDEIEASESRWDFLSQFGVRTALTKPFYFQVLSYLSTLDKQPRQQLPTVIAVYTQLSEMSTIGEAKGIKEKFGSRCYIHLPGPPPAWTTSGNCVWRGPGFLKSKNVLEDIYGNCESVKYFFADFLGMRDASYHDVLDDLTALKDSSDDASGMCPETVAELYATLNGMIRSTKDCADLWEQFESKALIHAYGRWLPPSTAIWNCQVELSGQVQLDRVFPRLRHFFVEKLKVSVMNPSESLREIAKLAAAANAGRKSVETTIKQMKAIMLNAGEILSEDRDNEKLKADVYALRTTKFLPVLNNNVYTLEEISGEYFIVDHERFGKAFRGKLGLLDFEYAEMTSLAPLFQVLGLEHRYLSRHVKSETFADSEDFSTDLSNHLRNRAYAMSCCAVSHQSPHYFNRDETVHNMLLNAEVFVSDFMKTRLSISVGFGDSDVEAWSDRPLAKVDHTDHGLGICVPTETSGFQSCYRTDLPTALVKVLGIQASTAVKQVYRILNDVGTTIDEILVHEDIPCVSWLTKVNLPESGRSGLLETRAIDVVVTSSRSNAHPTGISQTPEAQPFVSRPFLGDRFPSTPSSLASPGGTLAQVVRDNAYRKLLVNVATQARSVSGRIRDGALSVLNPSEALMASVDPTYDFNTLQQALAEEDDCFDFAEPEKARIGAAGELFVFELLQALQMPGFTIDQWQSTMRRHVRVMNEYSDLENWRGKEVADIMYTDTTSIMEEFLRRYSYNQFPAWPPGTSPIEYLLEVKSTAHPCSTPLFMSQNQYQHMQTHALPFREGQNPSVYVLMRVYNVIVPNKVGLEIFVDPWSLRDNTLRFANDTFRVIPPEPRSQDEEL